jgi:hypothetical protein
VHSAPRVQARDAECAVRDPGHPFPNTLYLYLYYQLLPRPPSPDITWEKVPGELGASLRSWALPAEHRLLSLMSVEPGRNNYMNDTGVFVMGKA